MPVKYLKHAQGANSMLRRYQPAGRSAKPGSLTKHDNALVVPERQGWSHWQTISPTVAPPLVALS